MIARHGAAIALGTWLAVACDVGRSTPQQLAPAPTRATESAAPSPELTSPVPAPASTAAGVSAEASSQAPVWPPLPKKFGGDFTMEPAQMKKLVGTSIMLPVAGQFTTLSVTSFDADGTVKIKDIALAVDLAGKRFKARIHALHSHAAPDATGTYAMGDQQAGEPKHAFIWHDFHLQPDGGKALQLFGTYADGRLLGYTYARSELARLRAGALVPWLGPDGWSVLVLDAQPTDATLTVSGRQFQLLDVGDERAGIIPKE